MVVYTVVATCSTVSPRLIAGEFKSVDKGKKEALEEAERSKASVRLDCCFGLFDPIWYVSKYGVSGAGCGLGRWSDPSKLTARLYEENARPV